MKNLSKNNIYVMETFENGYDINVKGELVRKDGSVKSIFRIDNTGYYNVTLRLPTHYRARVMIHKLQAYKKFGNKIFEKGIVVRHLNGNSLDNSWNNIDIGTQSDNMRDRSKEDLKNHAIKASKKRQDKIRTQEERHKIYEKLRNNTPYNVIIQENNISRGTLSFMKNKSYEYQEYIHNLTK